MKPPSSVIYIYPRQNDLVVVQRLTIRIGDKTTQLRSHRQSVTVLYIVAPNLVGGKPTPLKNMSSQYMEK
jgi:hypothetical protein